MTGPFVRTPFQFPDLVPIRIPTVWRCWNGKRDLLSETRVLDDFFASPPIDNNLTPRYYTVKSATGCFIQKVDAYGMCTCKYNVFLWMYNMLFVSKIKIIESFFVFL